MDSMDYHMLAAFRYETALLDVTRDQFNNSHDYQVIVDYMKARVHELERKFKES